MSDYDKSLLGQTELSFTLPSYLYNDADVFEHEKERIFYRVWQMVAHQGTFQKAGDYCTV
ncbi:MAG: hypothetical protein V3U65_10145 [Granulosicoccaceae bacterium]